LSISDCFTWFSSLPTGKCKDSVWNYAMITYFHILSSSLDVLSPNAI
jgi:hypothetical protein